VVSISFEELSMSFVREDGYRDSAAAINRALHRGDEASLRSTTLKDRTVSFGMRLADKYDELAHGILASQGIDPENGFPLQASSIPADALCTEALPTYDTKQAEAKILAYNGAAPWRRR